MSSGSLQRNLSGKGVVGGDRYNGIKNMMRVMAMNGYALHGKEVKVGLPKFILSTSSAYKDKKEKVPQ